MSLERVKIERKGLAKAFLNPKGGVTASRSEMDAKRLQEWSREMWEAEEALWANKPMMQFIEKISYLRPMGMDERFDLGAKLIDEPVTVRNKGIFVPDEERNGQ